MEILQNYILIRGKKCKGPEVQVCPEYSEESKEAMVAGIEGKKGKGVGDEIKAISGFMIRVF